MQRTVAQLLEVKDTFNELGIPKGRMRVPTPNTPHKVGLLFAAEMFASG
jgi:hypothetical protein